LGLLLAELTIRALRLVPPYHPEAEIAIQLHHEDPNGPIRLTPGWEGWVSGHWTRINERGFRDRLFERTKPAGVRRVAVFGDSYTMGDGVALEESLPKQLEAGLRERGQACEVMNCAVSATNSWNQLPLVREVLEEYAPDLVILGYNLNDFDNPTRTRFDALRAAGREFSVGADGRVRLVAPRLPWRARIRQALYASSHLDRFVTRLRRRAASGEPSRREALERWIEAGDHEHSIEAVARMQEACEKAGVPFLVALLPDSLRLPDDFSDYGAYPFIDEHAWVLSALEERGVEGVDLVRHFEGRRADDLAVHPTDRHFNALGNGLLAEGLARILTPRLGNSPAMPAPDGGPK